MRTSDPAHILRNTVPPPVHINAIVADRKSHLAQEALKLPAFTRDLEIDYAAPSFVAPKEFFRYMLERARKRRSPLSLAGSMTCATRQFPGC
jgi:hypothetical protein